MKSGFTCGYDTMFHLWRAVQVDSLWSQGIFYSRWAPDMAQGFGFPLFVFTSPGPSMVAVLLHRIGIELPSAIDVTFILGVIIGSFSMFLLADDLFGPSAGLVSAVAYAYAPFQAYDVFNRGSLWESFAWAFPPLVLWGIEHWAVRKERRGLIWGVIGLALLVLSHHLFAFLFAPLFAVWVLAAAVQQRDWHILWRGILVGLLGMGLTAFFWVPPLFERQFVQTDRLLGTWVFDFQYNFLSPKHLLALPRFADYKLINDWPVKTLGLVPVLISVCTLVGYRRTTLRCRWVIGVLALMTGIYAFLTLDISSFIWNAVPLLPYVQFPWRFLGPATFCVALLTGAASAALNRKLGLRPYQSRISFLIISILILANLGWFFPDQCEVPGDISIRSMLAWEQSTDTIGTTAKGEYLPVWVKAMPERKMLIKAYETGSGINRIDTSTLPSGTTISQSSFGAVSDTVYIDAAVSFEMNWLRFYYLGWRVKIDGESVPTYPAAGSGLLAFQVPAGSHILTVDFIETPIRVLSDVLSVTTFLVVILLLIFNRFQTINFHGSFKVNAASHIIFTVGLFLFIVLIASREGSPWRTTRLQENGRIRGVDTVLHENFDQKALLLGVDNFPATLRVNEHPEITLYWQAIRPGTADWQVGLTLADAEGEMYRILGLRPARWARTPPPLQEWSPELYARMDLVLDIPPGTPPGDYELRLKLFDRDSLHPASVLDDTGGPLGPDILLGRMTLKPPSRSPSLDSLGVPADSQPTSCGPLDLWVLSADRSSAAPGDLVTLHWVWESRQQTTQDINIPIRFLDSNDEERWVWNPPLVASWWPTSLWSQKDRWAANHGLRIPGFVESGTYSFIIGEELCEQTERLPIEIVAPERIWTVPESYEPVDVQFDARLALKGWQLEQRNAQPGQVVELSLAWQALTLMDNSYRIFVHVTGEDNKILTQNDGEPANWTRPTTGWAVDEVVIDTRQLVIPEDARFGLYKVIAGVYDVKGVRLAILDGEDAVEIAVIEIY